ncbi:MAG: N-acetyl sugar amidotransferase [Deltaproteobacteria bacterium]|nr:N-acetyl sugar amidotransferase [Deltaproteobacteria bacterium]
MKYCEKLLLPDTRPGVIIDKDGISNVYKTSIEKKDIDWNNRESSFQKVVERAKSLSRGYDCLIPVSGGKDSTWQVVKCLEYGLNPLAVTWKTPARTELGQKNLDNLISLGVDHIDYQINPKVESKFMLQALERFGSTAIPMHMALFNIPLKIAVRFEIPLVVWGENSAFEYCGSDDKEKGFKLDRNWLKKYGVTHGTTARDWVSESLSEKELTPYFGPGDGALEQAQVMAVFLGYYFPWDVENSLKIAKEHGFTQRKEGPRTGYYNYADIDDDFISIHHWLKWYKFGFTRLWDNLSLEIKNGRMTREEGIKIIKERGDETPHEDIKKFCSFVGISKAQFFEICEKFRNREIWFNDKGTWKIKDFLIPDWEWKNEI